MSLAAQPAPDPQLAVPALEISGLSVSYPRTGPVLQDVDLSVAPGSLVMVLGPSGGGKSTLLRAVKGLVVPQAGTVAAFGVPVRGGDRRASAALQRSIAWIPQNLGLVRGATVLDNVLAGALPRVGTLASLAGWFPAGERRAARELLDSLGIGAKGGERVYSLSGGERQRAAIARALMQEPRLVLADEFVSQLDPTTARETMGLVSRIAARGVTFLITSHQIELAGEFGDKVVFLKSGRKVHEGDASAFTLASVQKLMGR